VKVLIKDGVSGGGRVGVYTPVERAFCRPGAVFVAAGK